MSTIHLFGNNNYPTKNFGDLDKTLNINNLMNIEFSKRDERWVAEFLENLGEANLQLGDPDILTDADGFPYMHLKTVNAGENFKAFVIKNEIPLLLEKTFGIIINPQNERPDWILSSGDILNYYMNEEFYTNETIFSKNPLLNTVEKDEEILVGAPSEEILPTFVRRSLKELFEYSGIKNPKVMLIARNYKDEAKVTQDLVFNITPQQFSSQNDYQHLMKSIEWLLPKHYSFFGVNEMEVENGFVNL